jgi:hypothetical protein
VPKIAEEEIAALTACTAVNEAAIGQGARGSERHPRLPLAADRDPRTRQVSLAIDVAAIRKRAIAAEADAKNDPCLVVDRAAGRELHRAVDVA